MSGLLTVHLRVNDAATAQPTPVRLVVTGPGGEYYVPFGRSVEFPYGRNEAVGGHVALGDKRFTYIDGTCEIRLPTEVPLQIGISKGPEFEPRTETVVLGPGQMSLRLPIARKFERAGWMSADTRCHFLSPHEALLESAGEGLDFAHLLITEADVAANDGRLYRTAANLSAFSGQRPCLETGGHAVAVNTFNTHPALGRLALLNSHRPVFPLLFGSADETDDWSLGDWADQCHRKGGLVVWCDAYRAGAGLTGGEALVALLLGKVDCLEVMPPERSQSFVPFYYRLLDAGCRLPLTGASGKDSNRACLGSMRTYAQTGGVRGLPAWVEAARNGRTFVTNGPLLDFRVNNEPAGSVIRPAERLKVTASARSIIPFERLEVVYNGEVVANGAETVEAEFDAADGGWLAARCRGAAKSALYVLPAFAHTSPVYVEADGKPPRVVPAAVRWLRQSVQQTRDWVETAGRFARERSKAHLLELCDSALAALT